MSFLPFHLRFSRFSFFLASVMHIVSIIFFKPSQLNLSIDTFHGCFTPKICCILTWMSFVDVGVKCTLIRNACDWCLIVAYKRRLLGWNFSATIVDISPACWFVLVANCHTRYSWIGVLKIRKSSKCVFSFFLIRKIWYLHWAGLKVFLNKFSHCGSWISQNFVNFN